MKSLVKTLVLSAFFMLMVFGLHAQQLIYHDGFLPGQTGWRNYDDESTNAVVQDGRYILTHKKTTYSYSGTYALNIDESRDYSVETITTHLSGDEQAPFGLVFGAKDVSNLYYFAISGNGYYILAKQVDAKYNPIIAWTLSPAIVNGDNNPNKLRVEKRGSQLTLFINDQQVAQVPMVEPFGTSIGLVVFKAESAAFDHLTASYLPSSSTVVTVNPVNASVAEVAYHTIFSADDANQWVQSPADSASTSIAGGQYIVSRTAKNWYTSALSSTATTVDMHRNFLIETETTHRSGGQNFGYGLEFGADESRIYHFWIAATGYYYIGFTENNAFNSVVPFTQSDAVNKGEGSRNKLSIAHKNGQLYFYINDQQVETHPDLDFKGSRFGMSVAGPQEIGFNSLSFSYFDKATPIIDATSVPKIYITSPEVTRGLKVVQSSDVLHVAGIAVDPAGIFSVQVNDIQAAVDSKGNFTADVPMGIGDNPLMVTALNNGMRKGTYTFHVVRNKISATEQTSVTQVASSGKFYALLVGEQDYRDSNIPSLEGPVNDATNLSQALTANYTFLPENVTVLKNPSRAEFFRALDDMANKVKKEDNLVIFYAGHGLYDETHLQGYWFPSDAVRDRRDTWISNSDLIDYITAIQSKHTLLISDACFSGSIFKSRSIDLAPKDIQEVYKLPSRKAMTSGTMKEVPDKSVFMEYLVKRLNQNTDKFLPSEQLFASFKTAVINNSPNGQVPQFGEIRETGDEGGDFVFIKKDQ
ncbi:MAG TPA: caspase family protein [Mucilaginibacter sp.]|jgi:hypothetical protein|nr:caspase family protein [Mucilaginibacter sp.]